MTKEEKIAFILEQGFCKAVHVKDDRYLVEQNHMWGVYDFENKTLDVPCEYDHIDFLSATVYRVFKKDNRGIYNSATCELLIPCEYSYINHLFGHLYWVRKNEVLSIFNTNRGTIVFTKDKNETLRHTGNFSYGVVGGDSGRSFLSGLAMPFSFLK